MIGSKDPEYAVSQDKVAGGRDRDVHVLERAREEAPRGPARRYRHRAAQSRPRRRSSSPRWTSTCSSCCSRWPATRRRATRSRTACTRCIDHPDQFAMLAENPALVPSATEEILRWASPVMFFRRNVTKDTESARTKVQGGRQGQHLVYLGQSRRGHLPEPVHLRHHAHAQPARRVRRRRPALLPRREPGADGDEHPVRGIGEARRVGRARRARSSACARTSSTA